MDSSRMWLPKKQECGIDAWRIEDDRLGTSVAEVIFIHELFAHLSLHFTFRLVDKWFPCWRDWIQSANAMLWALPDLVPRDHNAYTTGDYQARRITLLSTVFKSYTRRDPLNDEKNKNQFNYFHKLKTDLLYFRNGYKWYNHVNIHTIYQISRPLTRPKW